MCLDSESEHHIHIITTNVVKLWEERKLYKKAHLFTLVADLSAWLKCVNIGWNPFYAIKQTWKEME